MNHFPRHCLGSHSCPPPCLCPRHRDFRFFRCPRRFASSYRRRRRLLPVQLPHATPRPRPRVGVRLHVGRAVRQYLVAHVREEHARGAASRSQLSDQTRASPKLEHHRVRQRVTSGCMVAVGCRRRRRRSVLGVRLLPGRRVQDPIAEEKRSTPHLHSDVRQAGGGAVPYGYALLTVRASSLAPDPEVTVLLLRLLHAVPVPLLLSGA
mmetsp:Transcript_8239/g.20430  ORF Transcript_8239/g.20430 Transcript_8239/m.20430 type:complete len:208 (+) Transcript_8239:907-1530(+)